MGLGEFTDCRYHLCLFRARNDCERHGQAVFVAPVSPIGDHAIWIRVDYGQTCALSREFEPQYEGRSTLAYAAFMVCKRNYWHMWFIFICNVYQIDSIWISYLYHIHLDLSNHV